MQSSATVANTNKKVAIKKLSKAFENVKDYKRILREIRLLRHFHHENVMLSVNSVTDSIAEQILSIIDILPPESKSSFSDIYLVCDLMDTDLQQIINSSQALSNDHCQLFVYQILKGLHVIHSANVIHRDLVNFTSFCITTLKHGY